MIKPAITKIEYFIPENDYSVSKIIDNKNKEYFNKIINKTGIDTKYKVNEGEDSTNLAISCIKKMFKSNRNEINEIDFVIYCNQTPTYMLPMSSSIIQKEIFERNDIGFIDISSGCSGYIYSLSLAYSLIKSESYKKILLITSDTYSKIIDKSDTTNLCIFGDGASTSIIENTSEISGKNYYNFDLGCDGSGIHDLYLPNSGISAYDMKLDKKSLVMNGTNVFSFAIKTVPATIDKCLKLNDLDILDIDYFVLHQANRYILETIRNKLNISPEKFIIDLRFGNTTSSSIPIALKNLIKENNVKKTDKILICGFGVGLSWGTAIIELNDGLIKFIKQN